MRFYSSATNTRGNVRGCGAHIMQVTHARGWDCGIKVVATVHNGEDVFTIEVTGGTNNDQVLKTIGTVHMVKGKPKLERP